MNPTLTNSELRQMEKAGLIGRDSADFWGLTSAGEALAVKLLKEMDKKYPPPRP